MRVASEDDDENDDEHEETGRVKILESYLAPTSFALEGTQVRKGTWLLAMRVLDDDLWSQVKSGELTGLSMGGSAARLPEPAAGSASART